MCFLIFPVFVDREIRRGISFGSVHSISCYPLFYCVKPGYLRRHQSERFTLANPSSWPGPWLISGKIHPLPSQKTLAQGWRGWLMRGSIYLPCQLYLSAGGWLTYCSQRTMGRLTQCISKYQRALSSLVVLLSWDSYHDPIRIWRYTIINLNLRKPFLKMQLV